MMDFSFEMTPWELFAEKLKWGEPVSSARFLTLLEGESEEMVEEAFETLECHHAALDVGTLPVMEVGGETGKRLALEARLVREGKLLEGFGNDDPLRMYLAELASIPVCGDPVLLSMELAETKDPEGIRERLVNLSLSRVVQLAGEYTGRGVLLMDLIQEGSMGLWRGLLSFDGTGDFEAERDWWIRQYMAKAVVLQARENGVGSKMRQALEDYRAADKRLLTRLGRTPTLEEIALELNMTPEGAYVIQEMLRSARTVQQAKASQEPQEETEDDSRHVEDTAYFQSRQRILELLSVLSETERQVLTLRFGLEGGVPMDPAKIGAKLGMSAAEITKMEADALSKLRS